MCNWHLLIILFSAHCDLYFTTFGGIKTAFGTSTVPTDLHLPGKKLETSIENQPESHDCKINRKTNNLKILSQFGNATLTRNEYNKNKILPLLKQNEKSLAEMGKEMNDIENLSNERNRNFTRRELEILRKIWTEEIKKRNKNSKPLKEPKKGETKPKKINGDPGVQNNLDVKKNVIKNKANRNALPDNSVGSIKIQIKNVEFDNGYEKLSRNLRSKNLKNKLIKTSANLNIASDVSFESIEVQMRNLVVDNSNEKLAERLKVKNSIKNQKEDKKINMNKHVISKLNNNNEALSSETKIKKKSNSKRKKNPSKKPSSNNDFDETKEQEKNQIVNSLKQTKNPSTKETSGAPLINTKVKNKLRKPRRAYKTRDPSSNKNAEKFEKKIKNLTINNEYKKPKKSRRAKTSVKRAIKAHPVENESKSNLKNSGIKYSRRQFGNIDVNNNLENLKKENNTKKSKNKKFAKKNNRAPTTENNAADIKIETVGKNGITTKLVTDYSIGNLAEIFGNLKIDENKKKFKMKKKVKLNVPKIINTKTTCAKDAYIYQIGYSQGTKGWKSIITACHRPNTSDTLYTMHTLYGALWEMRQKGLPRPKFVIGNDKQLYKNVHPDLLYKKNAVLNTFRNTLHCKATCYPYFNGANAFLAKGHLVPDADLFFAGLKSASYYLINTAPQWQSINDGNWLAVEKQVRNLAIKSKQNLFVITGTYGILKLKNDANKLTEMYLDAPKTRIAVPQAFWKIVYRSSDKKGIAFVTSNNPYQSFEEASTGTLCRSICDSTRWPLQLSNVTRGYTYCCSVNQLREKISYIPKNIEVDGPLQAFDFENLDHQETDDEN